VQFPGDVHETELKNENVRISECGISFWTPVPKTTGCAFVHIPLVDVMVNAFCPTVALSNNPAAVQFPGDVHETELKNEYGRSDWSPVVNSAGRAVAHVPLVDVMVNATLLPLLLNCPTAVQFPGDAHDTALITASL